MDINTDQAAILQNHVDSVIRTFEMSLAIDKAKGRDPVHFDSSYYKAMMHLQIDHVYHAFSLKNKHKKKEYRDEYWFKNMVDQ